MRFLIAVVLVLVSGFLQVLIHSPTIFSGNGAETAGALLGYVIAGPALLAALFCIPKKRRNFVSFVRSFNWVLLFSIFLGLAGFSRLATAADDSMEVFKSPDGAMQLSVPVSGKWESRSTEDNNFSLHLVSKSGNLIVTVLERDESGFASLKDAMQASLDKSKAAGIFNITANPAPCVIAGLECTYMEMERPVSDKVKLSNLVAIAAGSNYFYFFIATAEAENYPKSRKDFLNILGSIKETEAAKMPKVPETSKMPVKKAS